MSHLITLLKCFPLKINNNEKAAKLNDKAKLIEKIEIKIGEIHIIVSMK